MSSGLSGPAQSDCSVLFKAVCGHFHTTLCPEITSMANRNLNIKTSLVLLVHTILILHTTLVLHITPILHITIVLPLYTTPHTSATHQSILQLIWLHRQQRYIPCQSADPTARSPGRSGDQTQQCHSPSFRTAGTSPGDRIKTHGHHC